MCRLLKDGNVLFKSVYSLILNDLKKKKIPPPSDTFGGIKKQKKKYACFFRGKVPHHTPSQSKYGPSVHVSARESLPPCQLLLSKTAKTNHLWLGIVLQLQETVANSLKFALQ